MMFDLDCQRTATFTVGIWQPSLKEGPTQTKPTPTYHHAALQYNDRLNPMFREHDDHTLVAWRNAPHYSFQWDTVGSFTSRSQPPYLSPDFVHIRSTYNVGVSNSLRILNFAIFALVVSLLTVARCAVVARDLARYGSFQRAGGIRTLQPWYLSADFVRVRSAYLISTPPTSCETRWYYVLHQPTYFRPNVVCYPTSTYI